MKNKLARSLSVLFVFFLCLGFLPTYTVEAKEAMDQFEVTGVIDSASELFADEYQKLVDKYPNATIGTSEVILFDKSISFLENGKTVTLTGAILAYVDVKDYIGKRVKIKGHFYKQDESFQSLVTGPYYYAEIDGSFTRVDSEEEATLIVYNYNPVGPYLLVPDSIEVDEQGTNNEGWIHSSNGWQYQDKYGSYVTSRWLKVNDIWYYFNTNGYMVTDWQKISGTWYYFNSSGAMLTGWQKIGGKWYYLESGGAMVTGWKKLNNKWYYFQSSGAMVTGWQTIGGKTYYFKSSGAMAANEWCNGWWLNKDGSWTYKYKASWKQNSKGWWFGDESGWYAKNTTITINEKKYTFDTNGYMK